LQSSIPPAIEPPRMQQDARLQDLTPSPDPG
jgi:hypothetical protein